MNYMQSSILLNESHAPSAAQVSFPSISTANSALSLTTNSSSAADSNTSNGAKIHEFLSIHLTKSFDDLEVKKLYADFKSRGGISTANSNSATTTTRRLILKDVEETQTEAKQSTNNSDYLLIDNSSLASAASPLSSANSRASAKTTPANLYLFDCLDLFNRQHLAVLFYSQCENSPIYPNICHKPRIIDMKFYNENDMTLGKNKKRFLPQLLEWLIWLKLLSNLRVVFC